MDDCMEAGGRATQEQLTEPNREVIACPFLYRNHPGKSWGVD